MTASLPIQGITMLDVTIMSVDGNLAQVRANQAGGRTFPVRRDFMRAKGDLPYPGERWIVDRSFGNEWSFAMIISESMTPPPPTPRAPLIQVADLAARNALSPGPTPGQMVARNDYNTLDLWDGAQWRGLKNVLMPRPATLLGWTVAQPTASGNVYTVAQVAIPDLGWPYYVAASAGMLVSVSDNTSGFSHNAAIMIESSTFPTSMSSNVVSFSYLGTPQGGFGNLQVPWAKSSIAWTGPRTVYFLFRNGATGTASFGPLQTAAHYHFDVQLIPA